jgi:hypothetical protein
LDLCRRILTLVAVSGNRQLIKELLKNPSFLKALGDLMSTVASNPIGSTEFTPNYSYCHPGCISSQNQARILAEQSVELVFALSSCCDTPEVKSMFIETDLDSSMYNLYVSYTFAIFA